MARLPALSFLCAADTASTTGLSFRPARSQHYKMEMIPRALRAYQLYFAKYQTNGRRVSEVIVSQRTLFQLQVSYINVLSDLWKTPSRSKIIYWPMA